LKKELKAKKSFKKTGTTWDNCGSEGKGTAPALESVLVPPGFETAGCLVEIQPLPDIQLLGLLGRLEILDFQVFQAHMAMSDMAMPLVSCHHPC
jgi:hypothetical protein